MQVLQIKKTNIMIIAAAILCYITIVVATIHCSTCEFKKTPQLQSIQWPQHVMVCNLKQFKTNTLVSCIKAV